MLKISLVFCYIACFWLNAASRAHDDGWRWRNSLSIQLTSKNNRPLDQIDVNAIHERLYQSEIRLTPCCRFSTMSPPNTLNAAITFIIQIPNEQYLQIVTKNVEDQLLPTKAGSLVNACKAD